MILEFLRVKDVAELLKVSEQTARKRIKDINDELVEDGFLVERGKVNKIIFLKKYGFLEEELQI